MHLLLYAPHSPRPPTPPTRHPPSARVAKSAGKTSQSGAVWPPGQPADVASGRLVFNTNIHGTVFNTAAGKQTLAQFLDKLRINAASVFPPATFGRMVLNGGSGLRLVNDAAYPCTCESAWGAGRLNLDRQGYRPGATKGSRARHCRGWLPLLGATFGPWATPYELACPPSCSGSGSQADPGPGVWPQLRLGHCRRRGQCDLGQLALYCHLRPGRRAEPTGGCSCLLVLQPGAQHTQ